jgi:hypothetical protein
MATPFSSDNPHPLVRIIDFFKFVSDPCSHKSILIIHQDLYPACPVDAEVSDSNHDGQDDPTGDDDGGQGAPSAEPTVPHLIGSSTAAQVRPSATDQLTTTARLGNGPPKKKHLVLASKRKQHAPSDQVTTEFFPHHVPRCSLGLVAVKLVFGRLFEALQHLTHVVKIDTSAGADIHPAKRLRASPMRTMLASRYVTVLTCALLLVTFSKFSWFICDRRKHSTADPSKKLAQHASSSHATPVAPPAGVTGSTTLSAAEAWDYCRRAAEILEGLENREAD